MNRLISSASIGKLFTWNVLGILALSLSFNIAHADTYPAKPINLIAPFSAGGAADSVARLIAQPLSERLGQSVVVQNKPGVSGLIGTQFVAKAPADGYTIMIGTQSTHGLNKFFIKDLGYDPVKDFDPISMISSYGNVLVVSPDSAYDSVEALIKQGRAEPESLTFGTSGLGSSQFLAGLLFQDETGAKLRHIPYKGGAAAVTDVVGGQIDMVFETVAVANQLIKNNRLKALAVTSTQPVPSLPNVKTVSDQGVPGFEMESFLGVFAPTGIPPQIAARLNAEILDILKDPVVQQRLLDIGMAPGTVGLGEFGEKQQAQIAKWEKVVSKAGITPL